MLKIMCWDELTGDRATVVGWGGSGVLFDFSSHFAFLGYGGGVR